ncbi:hypothetical protein PIROE2DRAFT_62189 [Piromyces sp. E2]|nr:hypothetical protein PIROE2DRAFT_62189 [Piromyces sp. E2]|eukprot:OUM61993.1 hypothetical protein PIROE2DRAFT_62189 [Piromyces sp. E2]
MSNSVSLFPSSVKNNEMSSITEKSNSMETDNSKTELDKNASASSIDRLTHNRESSTLSSVSLNSSLTGGNDRTGDENESEESLEAEVDKSTVEPKKEVKTETPTKNQKLSVKTETGSNTNNNQDPLKPRRKTHVTRACSNCKKAHLACDVARPCKHCVNFGRADTCVDAIAKKRGRPKLKIEVCQMPQHLLPLCQWVIKCLILCQMV